MSPKHHLMRAAEGLEGQSVRELAAVAGLDGGDELTPASAERILRSALKEAIDGASVRVLCLGADGQPEPLVLVRVPSAELQDTPFEQSALRAELANLLLVAVDPRWTVIACASFTLGRSELRYHRVRADYESVRVVVSARTLLSAHLGELVEPRAEGGSASVPSAVSFHARPALLAQMLKSTRRR